MYSHEYANKLKEIADFLLSRPAFAVEGDEFSLSIHFYDKALAVAAVEAVQPDTSEGLGPRTSFLHLVKSINPDVKLRIAVYKEVALEPPPQPISERIAPQFVINKPEAPNAA